MSGIGKVMETKLSRPSEAHDKYQPGDLVLLLGPSKDYALGIGVIKKRLTGQEVFDILGQEGYRQIVELREKVYMVYFSLGTTNIVYEGSLQHANEK